MKAGLLRSLIFLLGMVLFAISCTHDPEQMSEPGNGGGGDCDTVLITYNADVYPIIQQHCLSCHSGAAPSGGLDFENYDDLAFVAQSGQLLGAIRFQQGFSAMPPNGVPLSECEIATIAIWIRDTTFVIPGGGTIPCDPDTVYFENTILPLLQSSCGTIGCHDPGTATERIILTNYQGIMNSNVIVPGNPRESELYEVITETDPDKRMPPLPGSSLTPEQIAAVFTWIQQGARDNYCDDQACDTVNVTFSETVFPIVQNHCLGCHSGAAPAGGLSLTNYNQITAAANSGALMGTIRHEAGYSPMPQNGAKLSDCKISQIQKWIDDGTPDN